jgi:hypothetical protein
VEESALGEARDEVGEALVVRERGPDGLERRVDAHPGAHQAPVPLPGLGHLDLEANPLVGRGRGAVGVERGRFLGEGAGEPVGVGGSRSPRAESGGGGAEAGGARGEEAVPAVEEKEAVGGGGGRRRRAAATCHDGRSPAWCLPSLSVCFFGFAFAR